MHSHRLRITVKGSFEMIESIVRARLDHQMPMGSLILRVRRMWRCVATALVIALLAVACATGQLIEHGFGFDAIWDSPGIEVLDFRYGRSSNLATMARPPGNTDAKVPQSSSIYGPMLRPDRLYVRWRIRAIEQIVEEEVALDRRLPNGINAQRVHFVIKGSQLCVYLVSKELLPREAPPSPLRLYPRHVVATVYPDAPANRACE
jgi:hypothetical protein